MCSSPSFAAGLALVAVLCAPGAEGATVTKRAGPLTIVADDSRAWPGGFMVVTVRASRTPGNVLAILDSRRVPMFRAAGGLRALVPIAVGAVPGPAVLGIEVRDGGRLRIPVGVTVAPKAYGSSGSSIPDDKLALLTDPARVRDSRLLLRALRSRTAVQRWSGPFLAPVAAPAEPTFGTASSYVGASPVERFTDSIFGEYHRGVDYRVAAGTPVRAPAAGTVALAQALTTTGLTVVIDHGQGVVSALWHLSALHVTVGQQVRAGQTAGLSGATGIAAEPHAHWGVYLYGIAVDPRIFQADPE